MKKNESKSKSTYRAMRAAYKAATDASKRYLPLADAYRNGVIGDDTYLAARKAHDEASAAYDAAEAAYVATAPR